MNTKTLRFLSVKRPFSPLMNWLLSGLSSCFGPKGAALRPSLWSLSALFWSVFCLSELGPLRRCLPLSGTPPPLSQYFLAMWKEMQHWEKNNATLVCLGSGSTDAESEHWRDELLIRVLLWMESIISQVLIGKQAAVLLCRCDPGERHSYDSTSH